MTGSSELMLFLLTFDKKSSLESVYHTIEINERAVKSRDQRVFCSRERAKRASKVEKVNSP